MFICLFLDYTKQRQSKESDIAGFITILDELLKETDERKNYLDEEIKNKQKQIADIRYEEISYSIYSIEEKKNKLAHEYEQLTLEKEQVVKEKEKLEKSRDILLCAKQNEAKNNAFSECKKLESRIEVSNKNEKEKEPARKELGKMLFKHYFKALSNCDSEIAEIKGSIVKQEEQEIGFHGWVCTPVPQRMELSSDSEGEIKNVGQNSDLLSEALE